MALTLAEQTLILSCLENYEDTLQEHRGAYVANGNKTGANHVDYLLEIVVSAKSKIKSSLEESK